MNKKNSNRRFLNDGNRKVVNAKNAHLKVAKKAQKQRTVKKSDSKTVQRRIIRPVKPKAASTSIAKSENKSQQKREMRVNSYIPSQKEANEALNTLFANDFVMDYLKKNVHKNAMDVLALLQSPNTDEAIALQLDMKVNSVRRVLNIMQGYGITNYYVAKNTNGWLSFAWYININKIGSFFDYIKSMKGDEYAVIKDDCNDYFMCKKCYAEDNIIFTFDAAYEAGFKCASCGSKFDRISKEEAMRLIDIDKRKQEALSASFKVEEGTLPINVVPARQKRRLQQ